MALEKNHVLVIGNNGMWAKVPASGDIKADILKAKMKCSRPKHYNVYRVTDMTQVSDHGSLLFPGDHVIDAPELIKQV